LAKAAAAAGGFLHWLVAKPCALLEARFLNNPLLVREVHLIRGPRPWRSPLLWAFVVMALPLLQSVALRVLGLIMYVRNAEVSSEQDWTTILINFSENWTVRVVSWAGIPLSILSAGFLICLTARAWARDRDPSIRDQIGASLLTTHQLIGAKTALWLFPVVVFVILGDLVALMSFAADSVLAPPQWRPLANWPVPAIDGWGMMLWTLLQVHFWSTLHRITNLIQWLMILGLATRFTLAHWRVDLTLGLTLACAAGVYAIVMPIYYGIHQLGWGNWVSARGDEWLHLALVSGVALAVWRGLPRHVARAYGMRR
jgi:hypothetical protein